MKAMSKAGAPFPATGLTDEGVSSMFKKIALSTAVAVAGLTAMPATAEAQSRYGYSSRYDNYNQDQRYNRGYNQRYDRRYANRRYRSHGYGNYYGRRCSNGSTGTIIGAIAGGLLGREIAGRGDRTVGAIIGAGAGALAGRAIDRNDCR
jgi:Glycine zipper 2TM domain